MDITLLNLDDLQELVIEGLVNPEAAQADVTAGNWDDTLCVLEGFEFGDISKSFRFPAGTYNIKIGLANAENPCGEAPVIEADVPFAGGESATVIAH